MIRSNRLWFVVPAAGIGQRMGACRPKQYLELSGATVLETTLQTLLSVNQVAGTVVALHANDTHWSQLRVANHKKIHTVTGGKRRCDSVLAALHYLHARAGNDDWVLVHDAARPCIHPESIQTLITTLASSKTGGILGVPVSDTLKQVNTQRHIETTLDRNTLWQAQTPQMFRYGILRRALEQAVDKTITATDEASVIEAMGYPVTVVPGRGDNIKVTHPDDLWLAEAILAHHRGNICPIH